jgi:hypothetical protein
VRGRRRDHRGQTVCSQRPERAAIIGNLVGYEVHITRAAHWTESEALPISINEWLAYVASDAEMRLDAVASATTPAGESIAFDSPGLAVWTAWSQNDVDGSRAWFDHEEGRVVVKNPDEVILQKMIAIAAHFGARVQGDDGECYPEVPGPTGQKPWWRRLLPGLLGFAVIVGCATAGPARASEPPAAPDVVRDWLGLLRAGALTALAEATDLPFAYQEAWPKKQCTSTARTRSALASWTECIRKDEVLLGELAFLSETLEFHKAPAEASPSLRSLANRFRGTGEWVAAYINGDGVTYTFLVLVTRRHGKARVAVWIVDAYYDQD